MDRDTIAWDEEIGVIEYIDQTMLPGEVRIVRCGDVERLAQAIRRLEIRGAPALGVAGAYGVALAVHRSTARDLSALQQEASRAADVLAATRPTAVNLAWGADRVLSRVRASTSPEQAQDAAVREAAAIAAEDVDLCRTMGEHGAALLPDTCTVLTHCNAGALACVRWGTALGVIRSAVEAGKQVSVIACETRPLFQGSRITAWELANDGIDVRVIPDSAAAHLMRQGRVDAVVVGADRVTHDAVFNKIGTYMHAVCARHHAIPFYVAAPYSTFDAASSEGDVVIELRSREEIAWCGERQLLPAGIDALNYAFDATPLDLVTALITERGVFHPPVSIEDLNRARQTI
ncbi:MAG: S-methyl-5-thioribose-1-phosphate isomerase [Methanomicrobiaceae archaeon]|nr:S-methyl-5-thioribose-1-phosphate isomerase [Methanomicrobiaceae archaeon]